MSEERECPDAAICQTCSCAAEDDVCFPAERAALERAERAEADLAFQKELADQIPRIQKVAYEAEARIRELEGALRELTEKVEQGWVVLRSPDYSRERCAIEGSQLRCAAEGARAALTDTSEGEA